MAAALDVIVHLSRMRDGSRKVTQVTEVGRMEGDIVLLQDIFKFDARMGVDDQGHPLGQLNPTGLRPHLTQRLEDRGVKVDYSIFSATASQPMWGPGPQQPQPSTMRPQAPVPQAPTYRR